MPSRSRRKRRRKSSNPIDAFFTRMIDRMTGYDTSERKPVPPSSSKELGSYSNGSIKPEHRHRKKKKRGPVNDFFYRLGRRLQGKPVKRKPRRSSRRYRSHRSSGSGSSRSQRSSFTEKKTEPVSNQQPQVAPNISQPQTPPEVQSSDNAAVSPPQSAKHYHSRKKRKKKGADSETGGTMLVEFITSLREDYRRKRKERKKKKYKKKLQKKHWKRHNVGTKRSRYFAVRLFSELFKRKKQNKTESAEHPGFKGQERHPRKVFYLYFINSTAIFVLSYLIIYLTYQFTVLISSSFFGLDSILFYYDLAFNDHSPLWTRLNIIFVTISGPVAALVIGLLFYRVFLNSEKVKGLRKLFFLWIAFHGFNFFLGGFVSGVATDQGFGYVAAWLYFNTFTKFLVSLVFLFILGVIGYNSTKTFLQTSNSMYRIKKENRNYFILSQIFMPWLIGSALIFLLKVPNNLPYETGMLLTMFFGVFPQFFNTKAKPKLNAKEKRKPTKINWVYFVTFLVLLMAFRIGLNNGIHFMMNFDISINIKPL